MRKHIMIVALCLIPTCLLGFDLGMKMPNMQGFKIDSNLRLNNTELKSVRKRNEFREKVRNYVKDNSKPNCSCPSTLASRKTCPSGIAWKTRRNSHCRQHTPRGCDTCYYIVMGYWWYDDNTDYDWCEEDAYYASKERCPK